MNGTNSISISELKAHSAQAVADVISSQNPKIIYQRSKPKAVLMDIKYYTALQEAYEDYLDILEFDETITQKRIPFSKHRALK